MLSKELVSTFKHTTSVPVVSGDPVDRPLGGWLKQGKPNPDVALIGIPFDGATVVPTRKGAAGGPAAVREALGDLNCYNLSLDIDFSELLSGVDLGDIQINENDSVEKVHDRVSKQVAEVIKSGVVPVSIGGDDSLCFAAARALCSAVPGKVGVIGFDAHLDMRVLYNKETSSGSSYRRMLDELEGQVSPKNMVHIGVNGWFAAKQYAQYARDNGITVITGDQVYERGMKDVMTEAIEKASHGTEAVYVNFDVDVLDQHYAPGKVMRNPGGMRGRDAYVAARMLGEAPSVRYFALNEVNVKRDVSNFTSLVGAYVIGYFLAGLGLRKERR
jgi:formimidoylglutamase